MRKQTLLIAGILPLTGITVFFGRIPHFETFVVFHFNPGFWGGCSYKVQIATDGAVIVQADGKLTRNVTHLNGADVERIKTLLVNINYFDLADRYDEYDVSDSPTVVTMVNLGNRSKSVLHYLGDIKAPMSLWSLESEISRLVGSPCGIVFPKIGRKIP